MTIEDTEVLEALVAHYGVDGVARELIEIVRANDEANLLELGKRGEYVGLQSISTLDPNDQLFGD